MDAIDAVVDAFVWPLRLLGIAQPAEGELNHIPLLSIPHNAIVNHLIPALTEQEKYRLSCSCRTLRQLVAATVTRLKLGEAPGTLCVAAKSLHIREYTNVTSIQLTVRGWHDIGSGAPLLLMHLSTALPRLQEITLLDKSHEDLYEPLMSTPTAAVAHAAAQVASSVFHATIGGNEAEGVVCEGCGYDTDLPDLTSVLVSLLALYPGLKKLEVYTKLLSVAEVAALSRLPQLTSLTLNSEDGVAPGALCSLSGLKSLQELRLGDVDGNNPDDVNTICDLVSRLTSLHMGYCPRLQPPVLRKVQQVHSALSKYLEEEAQRAEQERNRLEYQSAGLLTKAARAAAAAVLPSFLMSDDHNSSSSSNSHEIAPGGVPTTPHLRESEQMLIESGVPVEVLEEGVEKSRALAAAAAIAPQPEDSVSAQQIQQERQELDKHEQSSEVDQLITQEVNRQAALKAVDGQADSALPEASAVSNAAAHTPITSALYMSTSPAGGGVNNSQGPTLRLVTELSVNIDAEEGQEILQEMSQLSLLESLLVDSTDEFSFDPGFQPFSQTTNLRKLAITMPMSLTNTQSLQRCHQLRELLLCALPRENLDKGSMSQVTRLELLDIAANPPNLDLMQAFPSVTHMIIRKGADDDTLSMIGRHMTKLEHLELYKLPAGYSQSGLRGIAQLHSLKSMVLELASPGTTLGDRASRQYHVHNPLLVPFALASEVTSELGAAAGSLGVPLLGTNPILSFVPPSDWGMVSMLSFSHSTSHSSNWFPALRTLALQGYVAAADKDLHALKHLTKLHTLNMHLQRPRGLAGQGQTSCTTNNRCHMSFMISTAAR